MRAILGCALFLSIGWSALAFGSSGVGGRIDQRLKLSPPLLAEQLMPRSPANTYAAVPEVTTSQKTPFNAFFRSMIIPGWGQRYTGKGTTVGTITFVTDIALWGTVVGLGAYGNWKKDAYQTYAAAHAGIDNSDKDHQYYVDIGNYQDVNEFNEQQRRDRQFNQLYLASSDWWEWDSMSNRLRYRDLRIRSDTALNSRYYVAGAIFLNHLLSAIHASRQVKKPAPSTSQAFNTPPRVELTPELTSGSIGLRLTGRF
jgi:hypothetical protein